MRFIHKVCTLKFCNFRPPLHPCTCTYIFSLHSPFPPASTSLLILSFKEDTEEEYFLNYYQSKNHKQNYKIKKLLYKAIAKCCIVLNSLLCRVIFSWTLIFGGGLVRKRGWCFGGGGGGVVIFWRFTEKSDF